MVSIEIDDIITFKYINWRGEMSLRQAIVKDILFGSSGFHHEAQVLIHGWDLEKEQYRLFAAKDIMDLSVKR